MPSITYDGRSLLLEGRRIWIVSGAIHYARVPHQLWAERIHAAKAAGLNTIETPVFWSRHEPRPGHFDFAGDNDIRRFVELVGQAGMWCILRPGPYVGQGWDMGGLPPWLAAVRGMRLRVSHGPFLEACSRYISALAEQVRHLQATEARSGPILLIQNEHQWICGDDDVGLPYLNEIHRYFREAGFTVPIINANNLWQSVEGEIDAWVGSGDLLGTVRQLAAVRPDHPRLIIEFEVGEPGVWNRPAPPPIDPLILEQRLAQILAAGGQFNVQPFHGGTNFGFWGGRLPNEPDAFVIASNDAGGPLGEGGLLTPAYHALRRIATFASRFARIFAHLDPAYRPVMLAPPAPPAAGHPSASGHARPSGVTAADVRAGIQPADVPSDATVACASGSQGSVVFVFNPAPNVASPRRVVSLILPDGTTLPVDLTGRGVVWCLFDTAITPRARLDYSSLSAFGAVGRVLVLFGPAGSEGRVSINGSPLTVVVPTGPNPAVLEHEGVTLVICAADALSWVHLVDDAVYVGVAGLTSGGLPRFDSAVKHPLRISADGQSTRLSPPSRQVPAGGPARGSVPAASGGRPRPVREGRPLPLTDWTVAWAGEYCDGTSPRFAAIDAPADLTAMGSAYGYGWYRVRVRTSTSRRVRLVFPHAGDRLHVFREGRWTGTVGVGPAAERALTLPLNRGTNTLVFLADNLGRYAAGNVLGEPKGLFGTFYHARPLRLPRPTRRTGDPVHVLLFRSPMWGSDVGTTTLPERVTWTFRHRRRSPVLLTAGPAPLSAIVVLNDRPVAFLDRGSVAQILLSPEQLEAGTNVVQLAVVPEDPAIAGESAMAALAEATFEECVADVGAGAEWAFARWEPPRPGVFEKPRGGSARRSSRTLPHTPAWWRTHLPPVDGRDLWLDPAGLTKGQLYVNARHVCRYFVTTAAGRPVPPQSRYYIPGVWLHADSDNELLLFDEHGASPARCRLVFHPSSP